MASLGDELRDRQRRDGIVKAKFYVCPHCHTITESFDIIDKCLSCNWRGELDSATTYENALKILDHVKQPGYNPIMGKITKEPHDEQDSHRAKIAIDLAKATGFIKAAKEFVKEQPLFYDRACIWWLWNHDKRVWEQTDETDILNVIRDTLQLFGDATVKSQRNMLEALKQIGRATNPKELPVEWVQFQGTQYNIKTAETRESTPEWFSTNTIPHEIGETDATPTLDKLFTSWVGEEHVITLYEILAYCCYRNYPLHVAFALCGGGRNGKSTFIRVIIHFVGEENIASTDLERLAGNNQRPFETFNLYKKLAAIMGETNYGMLDNTSLFKRLTGQDPIPYEPKGKKGFTDYNYAKLIIASNGLPTSADQSEGYFRRWIIVKFPNEFPEGKDILETIPESEYRALARKVALILPDLLARHEFTNQGSVEERKQRYIAESNPLNTFLKEYCLLDHEAHVRHGDLYLRYLNWLKTLKMRKVLRREFNKALEDEGLEVRRTTINNGSGQYDNGTFVFGIAFKEKIAQYDESPGKIMQDMSVMQNFPLPPIRVYEKWENPHNRHILHNSEIIIDTISELPPKQRVLAVIRKLAPQGSTVGVEAVLQAVNELGLSMTTAEQTLSALKHSGEVFEPRLGFVGVLE